MTFFDQKAVFNEILLKGRRFNVFLGELIESCEEGNNFGKSFFEKKIFLEFFAAPLSCGPPACGKCGSTRYATGAARSGQKVWVQALAVPPKLFTNI